jgi:hypothetical protein
MIVEYSLAQPGQEAEFVQICVECSAFGWRQRHVWEARRAAFHASKAHHRFEAGQCAIAANYLEHHLRGEQLQALRLCYFARGKGVNDRLKERCGKVVGAADRAVCAGGPARSTASRPRQRAG